MIPSLALALLVALPGEDTDPPRFDARETRRILAHTGLPGPPPDPTNAVGDDPRAAALGQFLFFDPRLSRDGSVSCATCHDPRRGFSDGVPIGEGLGPGRRHTMTLWNAAYQRWLFWDGRADSLWAQALRPIESENELGSSRVDAARLVHDDPLLRTAYEAIFGSLPDLDDAERFPPGARPVPGEPGHPSARAWNAMRDADREAIDRVFASLGKSIAAYERRLVSPSSPFDRFAARLERGEATSDTDYPAAARRGLRLFAGRGNCRLCHVGPNLSDGEFHDTGVAPRKGGPLRDPARYEGIPAVLADPFNAAGAHSDDPEGPRARELRYLARTSEAWGQFRTPTLRNVARTAPYMHEGQLATLEDVVRFYSTLEGAAPAGHHGEQLLVPLDLTEREIADLVAFLETLTDESVDPALLEAPASPFPASRAPESAQETPRDAER